MEFEPTCHRDIITLIWGNDAKAYCSVTGVLPVTWRSHKRRNNIPNDYWDAIIAAAQRLGYPLTEALLKKTKVPNAKTLMCKERREEKVSSVA